MTYKLFSGKRYNGGQGRGHKVFSKGVLVTGKQHQNGKQVSTKVVLME